MKDSQDQEIDLAKLYFVLKRRKRLVLAITLVGFILGIFKSFTTKPVFQGEFQIVIENDRSKEFTQFQPSQLLTQLGSSNSKQLKTQVKILESSSVLMPIFEFAKDYKLNLEVPRKIKYKDWTKNLKISLEPGTSVLNISYKDTNKLLIIKILDKISLAYQEYSGREKNKSMGGTIIYLEDQIKKYKLKSSSSMENFQKFAIKNGLGAEDGLFQDANEVLRNKNSNNNLTTFNTFDDNTKNRYRNHFAKLSFLEAELVDKEALLTPNSSIISNLKTRIKSLKDSLDKPSEIINKYRELKNVAIRDELTLIQLEEQLNLVNLKKAKEESPWQLISTPTLLENRVAPKKTKLTTIYTILGFLISTLLAIYKDKKSKIIYSLEDLKNKIPYPLLKVFHSLEENEIDYGVKILFNSLVNNNISGKIGILSLNNIDNFTKEKLLQSFKVNSPNQELLITDNLNKIFDCNIKILLVNAETIKSDKLENILSDLFNNCKDINGWIYVKNK